jgi:hypothetical protein
MVYYKKPGKWAAMTASGIDFAYVYDFFRVDFGTVPTMWFYFSLQYRNRTFDKMLKYCESH